MRNGYKIKRAVITITAVVALASLLELGQIVRVHAAAYDIQTVDNYNVENGGIITKGPDGNIWGVPEDITAVDPPSVMKVEPNGAITTYPVSNGGIRGITAGPDGNIWFTEQNGNSIGKITTSGVVTEYPLLTPSANPASITTGPDGNLWFAEQGANQIGKITTSGVVTEYPLPTSSTFVTGITAGPDGNIWFTEAGANQIGKITTSGVVTEYPLPTPVTQLGSITTGPDGNLWFTEAGMNNVGMITPTGTITEYPLLTPSARAGGITTGPDGNLWFTESSTTAIGRMTPAGVVTMYPGLPTYNPAVSTINSLANLVFTSDTTLWVAAWTDGSGAVIKITFEGSVPSTPPGSGTPTAGSQIGAPNTGVGRSTSSFVWLGIPLTLIILTAATLVIRKRSV